jgi:cytochrome c-type biogenesis protein CcmF
VEYLSHLYLPGAMTLWCAFIFGAASLVGYADVLSGNGRSLAFARRSYGFFAVSILLTGALMVLLLLLRDYRIEYVYQYSGNDLPTHYQFAAFWAGQKGSFLIWLTWGSLLGLLVQRSAGAGKREAGVMGIYTLTVLALLLILIRENPFKMLPQTPGDGVGLNPLLQDNWMVIHPPIMFIGYAMSAIPFAFAMASLWRRDYDGWVARAFPWALAGFLVLGTAILMGGYWAYKTLGWGGFWGWDPVENASLIPWIFGTVMIHGMHLERTRGRYRRANYVFATLTYMSVLYGTFLTRSGVLADFSVHSFVDLGISGWLIALMGTFAAISIFLLATRLRQVPTQPNEDPLLSRGMFLVLGTITLLAAALVITAGTSAPLLTRFMANPGQVGPSFYNQVNLPLAILIALLLALVPFLSWKAEGTADPEEKLKVVGRPGVIGLIVSLGAAIFRGEGPQDLRRKLAGPTVFALAVAVGAALWKVHQPFHLLFIFLSALALATNAYKTVLKYRAGGLRGAGGYLAHVGVGVILLGIVASSAYDKSTKVTLEMGAPRQVGDATLTFIKMVPRRGFEKEGMEIKVVRKGKEFTVTPRMFMNDRTRQLMVNPDIKSSLLADFYVSPIEFDPGQSSLQLAKGDSGQVGSTAVRFVAFDLDAEGNAMAQMAAGKPVVIGAKLDVTRDGKTSQIKPLYRLNPATGQVEAIPAALPGGGQVAITGIDASNGAVRLEVDGVNLPARLSIDVTEKPLIQLVWGGLYIVLIGGLMATVQRLRQARMADRIDI